MNRYRKAMHSSSRWLFPMVCFLWPLLAPGEGLKGFEKGSGKVSGKDLGSHHAAFEDTEAYLERWMVVLERKDGGWMQLNFVLTNLGPGSKTAGIAIKRWASPVADPKGKKEFYHWHSTPTGDLVADADNLNLDFGHAKMVKKGNQYVIEMDIWNYELEVTLTSRVAEWKPGDGAVKFPGNQRLTLHTLPTNATFTGRERRHKSEWQPITGTAFGEHAVMSILPHHLADKWLSFNGRNGKHRVTFLELYTPDKWANERFGYLLVTRGNKVLAQSLNARATVAKTRGNYKVPTQYEVKADGMTLRVETGRLIYKEEVLATVPKLIRAVIKLWLQPVKFYNRARFELTLSNGDTVKGKRGWSTYAPMRRPK